MKKYKTEGHRRESGDKVVGEVKDNFLKAILKNDRLVFHCRGQAVEVSMPKTEIDMLFSEDNIRGQIENLMV